MNPELTVMICTVNEEKNISRVIRDCNDLFQRLSIVGEILIVDGCSSDRTASTARGLGAEVITQPSKGYGNAVRYGLSHSRGEWILVADSDGSHPINIAVGLWAMRQDSDVVVASRFEVGGADHRAGIRPILSLAVNWLFGATFGPHKLDFTGSFRLYRSAAVSGIETFARDFDVQPELLVRLIKAGAVIRQLPYEYSERKSGSSKARILRYGLSYLMTWFRLANQLSGGRRPRKSISNR